MNFSWEEIAMQLILHGGNARALAYEAIAAARNGNIKEAEKTLKAADTELNKAHLVQTQALQNVEIIQNTGTPLIMVHAQDHLMTAMAEKNLITEMVALYKKLITQDIEGEKKEGK